MNYPHKRIESIDALRAFALLGILVVHTSQLYNFNNEFNDLSYFTDFGYKQINFIKHFLQNRFIILFSILFGTSFYLILKNPAYSQKKFCWRCILLIVFGLINKIFYTTDILVWYGLNGIILSAIPIRQLSAKYILLLAIVVYFLSFLSLFNWGNLVTPEQVYTQRYLTSTGIKGILSYPYLEVLKEDIHMFGGLRTLTLSYFLFGYYIGKSQIIERIDIIVNYKTIIIFIILFILATLGYKSSGYHPWGKNTYDLIAALLYAALFIFIFNKCRKILSFMCLYGKLGLTHYSVQNVLLPIIIAIILIHTTWSFELILLISLLFYCLQTVFSIMWLRYYKYGPLEYIWRIFTNLKYISNARTHD